MRFALLILSIIGLLVASLFIGAVNIPADEVAGVIFRRGNADPTVDFIVLESRLPQSLTAILAGAALAASGLMMQTMFRNPLAGPSILGISSGSSLGVALVMLMLGSTLTIGSLALTGYIAVIIGAFVGSLAVMALLIMMSSILRSDLMLVIAGVMVGYIASSLVTLLNYSASAHGLQGYIMWGMGSFGGVNRDQLVVMAVMIGAGLLLSLAMVKPLNVLMLGDNYARNLGVHVRLVRNLLLLATGWLTAVATAFCGPIAFIGLAVPHIARLIFPTDNHRVLMPATILVGSAVALLCSIVSMLPEGGVVPVNAITPLIGVPVVLYVIIRRRR